MRLVTHEQGSHAWYESRLGKITASSVHLILARGKNGEESRTRRAYRNQLISERITGVLAAGYAVCEAELVARCLYEVETGTFVDQVGSILHPKWNFASASPDGLIGDDGGLEIKCYDLATHDQWVRGDKVPNRFVPQCLWGMICAERQWWDFCSWNQESETPLFIRRLFFDKPKALSLELAVYQFNQEIEEEIASLKKVVPIRA